MIPLFFDPINGKPMNARSEPVMPELFRSRHPGAPWLYNPWTGEPRDHRDIALDVAGRLITPPVLAIYSGTPDECPSASADCGHCCDTITAPAPDTAPAHESELDHLAILRDHFAGCVLQGLYASGEPFTLTEKVMRDNARIAWAQARVMLELRGGGRG